MKKITELEEAFEAKLQELYDIEQELLKALPKLAKAATDLELVGNFNSHLKETEEHVKRLEEIFEMVGKKPGKIKSEGIRGISEDGNNIGKTNTSTQLKDSMLASEARFVEHFEMAGYLAAIQEASALGLGKAESLLRKTLEEERAADQKLEACAIKNFQKEIV